LVSSSKERRVPQQAVFHKPPPLARQKIPAGKVASRVRTPAQGWAGGNATDQVFCRGRVFDPGLPPDRAVYLRQQRRRDLQQSGTPRRSTAARNRPDRQSRRRLGRSRCHLRSTFLVEQKITSIAFELGPAFSSPSPAGRRKAFGCDPSGGQRACSWGNC